jgi:hypothetical protein
LLFLRGVNVGVWGRPSKASFALSFGNIFKERMKEPIFTGLLLKENCAEAIKLLIYYNNRKNTNSIYVN